MIQYSADGKTAFYCGYRFRKDPKTGYFLCSKKTEIGKRERLHCFVYRKANGLDGIPDGFSVHHIDEDKSNNEPGNLVLLSDSQHAVLHASEWNEEKRERVRENLNLNVRPAACAWHGSDAGRKWHRVHYEEMKSKLHQMAEFVCDYCGKHFIGAANGNTRFCSNNCKSAYRRKSGVDDEQRSCARCGADFSANKYSTRKYCAACKGKASAESWHC